MLTKPGGGQTLISSPEPPESARRGLLPRELVLEPHEFITTVNAWSSDNHGGMKEKDGCNYTNYGAIGSLSVRSAIAQCPLAHINNLPSVLPLPCLPAWR